MDETVVTDGLEDETYYLVLAANWNRDDDNGVDSTPAVLIDGEEIGDPFDVDEIISTAE